MSYSEADYKRAMEDFDAAMEGKVEFEAPNFDLFLKACRTTAKALFPNFMFLDTPFNQHENGMPAIQNVIAMNWQQWDAVRVSSKT